MSEPYYGGESVAIIAALTAILRAEGLPLDQAAFEAERRWSSARSGRNSSSFGRAELLSFLASFKQ